MERRLQFDEVAATGDGFAYTMVRTPWYEVQTDMLLIIGTIHNNLHRDTSQVQTTRLKLL